jgi:hypothetical protein
MSDVHDLEASNAQLRQLVAQYMADPSNSELHVPPAATIRIEPAALAALSASSAGGAAAGFAALGPRHLGATGSSLSAAAGSHTRRLATSNGRGGGGGGFGLGVSHGAQANALTSTGIALPVLSITSSPMPVQPHSRL